uniref:Uncharacterized protein n=1 Tax=Pristionchus pacificus TaxID=54126 RepID=A0A8R1UKG2_PRIPA
MTPQYRLFLIKIISEVQLNEIDGRISIAHTCVPEAYKGKTRCITEYKTSPAEYCREIQYIKEILSKYPNNAHKAGG